MAKEWFASWFDSPYYPILYRHRDYAEAEAFVLELLKAIGPSQNAHFLDLACGRGRHSHFLHAQGFRVTGLDLSADSIRDARELEKPGLDFGVHDMREAFPGSYDHILNLFTSFGYFDDTSDNLRVLRNVRAALRPGGTFVLDFMNVPKVLAGLVPAEEKTIDGIEFSIQRMLEDGYIIKEIGIRDGEESYDFREKVQALDKEMLIDMIEKAGLEIYACWGDYAGKAWEEMKSPRLIFFCR